MILLFPFLIPALVAAAIAVPVPLPRLASFTEPATAAIAGGVHKAVKGFERIEKRIVIAPLPPGRPAGL
jgi:hypothetical protein